ncbi:glycosyl transferase family group 2-domain-containing protein [Phellopilus nigrolimitatus]|nr:glycosyl transferase family group 2-domain-containing protein [Phellopilus nigrolimitatus]
MDYDAYDAILHHLFKQTQGDAWFKPSEENVAAGVCLRVQPGHFRVFPYENHFLAPFEAAVRSLNPVVALKIRSAAVHAALATIPEDEIALYVDLNTRIQILDTMSRLPRADKEQCAAFIRDERVLIVWADDLDNIIPLCRDFEDKLIKLVWRARPPLSSAASAVTMGSAGSIGLSNSLAPSYQNLTGLTDKSSEASSPTKERVIDEKEAAEKAAALANAKKGFSWFGWRTTKERKGLTQPSMGSGGRTEKLGDYEAGEDGPEARPIRLFAPIYGGLGAGMSIFFVGSGINIMVQEWMLDGNATRFAILATAPFLFCVSLFFALQVITNISYVLGPVAQFHENSKYYSAVAPKANKRVDNALPHITIQMPVYKESLKETITPSVESLKKAMQTYARQGGTSTIFVNDDGLQLLKPDERASRLEFYANHGIGFVARPPHSNDPDGFHRAGRFKKASNMNYGLALSLKLEKCIKKLEDELSQRRSDKSSRAASTVDLQSAQQDVYGNYIEEDDEEDYDDDEKLEERALQMAIEETFEETGSRWRPWAAHARSLRVGDIILIVDSDTIVPEDCLRDAARELAECPEVAIIQHESDVMQVAHHYFENGIAHFTRRINRCISMACANGEVAPFVGHNAFLRWSAIQDAAFIDEADGLKKIWSEANVSEDFDMALRLQLKGYSIRWASYSNGGFKEGVSLTCDDELNRWQKYAYGCNELIFNPLIHWWRRGPINKQLHVFLWSDAPVHYKISMMSYMFSYYGIAAAIMLSLLNYLLLGFAIDIDGFYMHSFEIWLACTVVFPGAGNLGFTLLEYRLGTRSLLESLIENLTWVPFFFFFFGGLSIHLTQALLAHLFSYNITWGATKKEVERSNFFIEVPKILRRFWLAIILSLLLVAMMIVLSLPVVPVEWQVTSSSWAVIFPLAVTVGCHLLYPIILNPWLMIFSY